MSFPLNIVIVEKNSDLKMLAIKEFKEDELFKINIFLDIISLFLENKKS